MADDPTAYRSAATAERLARRSRVTLDGLRRISS